MSEFRIEEAMEYARREHPSGKVTRERSYRTEISGADVLMIFYRVEQKYEGLSMRWHRWQLFENGTPAAGGILDIPKRV